MWVRFRLIGDGFENCPFPVGTKVKNCGAAQLPCPGRDDNEGTGYEVWLGDGQQIPSFPESLPPDPALC